MAALKITCLLAATFMMLVPLALTQSTQQEPTTQVMQAQRNLLQLTPEDDTETAVPTAVRDAISGFKQALVLQTDAVITHIPADATAISAEQYLSSLMPAATVGKMSDEQWRKMSEDDSKRPIAGLYGGGLTFSISQPRPYLMLVQESFDIACGTDTVLLSYSNISGAWKRILLWKSKPYDQVSGAFGDTYETLLLKPKRNNHPLLLVLHGTPWCSSTMSGFAMDVLELGSPLSATLMWHGQHGYRRLDLDPPLTLRPTADGFEVRTSVGGGGDHVSRKGVMRYSVSANGVHRVEPLAMNAQDSVVEWLELPRKEAARFADQAIGSLTWQMFGDFTYEGKGKEPTVPHPYFGAVRACKDSHTHFQAEVTSSTFDGSKKGSRPGPAYFVQLQEVPNGYRIHFVTPLAERACTGPDLMAESSLSQK